MNATDKTIRLGVSRHLQDFNGYCGPACALMIVEFTGSAMSPPVFAQNEFFREIRSNAKASKDRRPVKSPAESLLTMLNHHTAGEMEWKKIFNTDSFPVAKEIFLAVEEKQQPCLLLVSKGMHWVVAFGVQRMENGRPAGYLLRDPAWAGMPKFYGLSIFPDTPAIEHSPSPCPCLSHTENPPGCVHERYITVEEMLSHRGLQGSPDWEGIGAIALVPDSSVAAAIVPAAGLPALVKQAQSSEAVENPQAKAGAAALDAVKENGLYGRPDSPEEWNKALTGATAGDPILVKDPDNPADDFYLVPLNPSDPTAKKGAWAMLDAKTLALREVSLLENWKTPAFPSNESKDAQKASEQQHTLPDGTKTRFKKQDLKPNTNNLVWAASAACVLPYWPAKELIAPHPVTGQPVSIYVTQEGEVLSELAPDNLETPQDLITQTQLPKKSVLAKIFTLAAIALPLVAIVVYFILKDNNSQKPVPSSDATDEVIILESFENNGTELSGSKADTGQVWTATKGVNEDSGKLTINATMYGDIKLSGLEINAVYTLSMDVNVTAGGSDWFGFGFRTPDYYDLIDGTIGAMLHRHSPEVQMFGMEANNRQTVPAKQGLQSLTITLKTGSTLQDSELKWSLDGNQIGRSVRVSASNIDGVFLTTNQRARGTIDNFKLTIKR